jgi:putative membrane protein
MKKLAVLSTMLLLATPVLAETMAEKTGVNSVLGVAPTTADFVKEAAISDMFEIQSSMLAESKSDAGTKAFAARMIADHKKTTAAIKTMAKAPIPTELDSAHQSMLDKLKGLSGGDFTKTYHDDQVSAHKDAVSLFERYAKGGDDADLKAFADKTLPTLRDHLKMAQDLDKSST